MMFSHGRLPVHQYLSLVQKDLTLPRVPQSGVFAVQFPWLEMLPMLSYRDTSHLRLPTSACASFSLFTYVPGAVPAVLQAQHELLRGSPRHQTTLRCILIAPQLTCQTLIVCQES